MFSGFTFRKDIKILDRDGNEIECTDFRVGFPGLAINALNERAWLLWENIAIRELDFNNTGIEIVSEQECREEARSIFIDKETPELVKNELATAFTLYHVVCDATFGGKREDS